MCGVKAEIAEPALDAAGVGFLGACACAMLVRACALTALYWIFSAECGPARDVLAALSPGATVGGGAGPLGAAQPGACRVSSLET